MELQKQNLKFESLRNPLIKNMAVYIISDGIAKAMPFLVFPIVAYYLTSDEFGLVNNYQVLLGVLSPFIGLSTSSYFAVEYYRTGTNNKVLYNNIIYFNLILLFLTSVAVICLTDYISGWTKLTAKWIYMALLSMVFIFLMDLFLVRLRMEEKARIFGIFNVVKSVISVSLTILFVVVLKMAWEGRIYSLFITTVLGGCVALIFTWKFIGKIHRPVFRQMRSFLIFGLPLLPHHLSIWIRTGFDKIFITSSIGLSENGVYSFAVTISAIFTMFSGAFFAAFSPYAYKVLAKNELESAEKQEQIKIGIVKKSYTFLAAYLVVLVIGFFAAAIFINLFFKEKYGESIEFVPYLLAYNLFNTAYIFVSMMIYYSKSTKYLGLITILSSLIQVLLVMFLVRLIGPKGAAISAMVVSLWTLIVVYAYSNRVFPMPWLSLRNLIKCKSL